MQVAQGNFGTGNRVARAVAGGIRRIGRRRHGSGQQRSDAGSPATTSLATCGPLQPVSAADLAHTPDSRS
jgi:hypothetical protein